MSAGQINYATAKAGITGMMLVFARELERYGVTANAISPRARTRMTEGAFDPEVIGPGAGGFDAWDPANVSPVVAWLASDEAAAVSGQHFVVFGGEVHLMEGWTVHATLAKDGRWTPAELAARTSELFGDRPTGVPEPPIPLPGQG